MFLVHPAFVEAYYRRGSAFQRLIRTYVGTRDHSKVARPGCLAVLHGLEQLCAGASVCVWIWQTYRRETTASSRAVLLACTTVDVINWGAGRLQAGCGFWSLWHLDAIVDVLTAVPVLVRAFSPDMLTHEYDDWLSLHFLRSYSALCSFERARRVAQLDEHTAGMTQVMAQMVLRVCALLTIMAGTTLTFEILGDPHWMRDSFLVTHTDDRISFLQMVYWIVISITTVGYGDFAPRTVITRVLTTVFIVVGVASVYLIQLTFSEMRRRQHEGTGKYWQRSWGQERHVVVILCHHGSASRMASLIHGFLQELLHASHNETEDHHDHASSVWAHLRLWLRGAPPTETQTWPDVVFLSPTKWTEEELGSLGAVGGTSFRDFLESTEDFPSRMLARIWFLVGGITSEADLERARVRDSALTYVLSDLKSANPDEDDAQTIYTAVAIRDIFPDVRLRLMVMKPESKELAVQAGIDSTRCFSSRELAASLLAQNARCRGLIPAVTAMLKSVDCEDEAFFLRQALAGTVANARPSEHGEGASPAMRLPASHPPDHTPTRLSLEEMERSLRKSQAHWCPRKKAYEKTDPWMLEYFEGVGHCIFGFDLNAQFAGLQYGALACELFRVCGAVLLGVQQNGKLRICPQGSQWRAKEGQICIAIAQSAESLDPCRLNHRDRTSWRTAFQAARRRRRCQSQSEGRHVAAAKLMGRRLQHSLLEHLQDPAGREAAARAAAEQACAATVKAAFAADGGAAGAGAAAALYPQAARPVASSCERADSKRDCADLAILPVSPGTARPARSPDGRDTASTSASAAASDAEQSGRFARGCRLSALEIDTRFLRSNLKDWEDLVVMVVCHGEIWQQVRTFVGTLRQEYLPAQQPVIVLAPTAPPPGLLEDCGDRVVCMQGSCLRAQSLIEAGILEAGTVVAFAGEVSCNSRFFDYRTVLTGQELECWLGVSPKHPFGAFELHDSQSAKHLPRLRMKMFDPGQKGVLSLADACAFVRQRSWSPPVSPKSRRHHADEFAASPVASKWEIDSSQSLCEDEEEDEREGEGIEDSGHRRRTFGEWVRSFAGRAGEEKSHDSIIFDPRFAAGQVFTPELWGIMLGRMFYMPAVIELVEALVMPSRREQNAYMWQVRVPPAYVGQAFGVLFADLSLGLPLDNRGEADADQDARDFRGLGPSAAKPQGPPAIPIALYRLRAEFSLSPDLGCMRPGLGVPFVQQHRLTAEEVTDQQRTVAECMGGHHFLRLSPQENTPIRDGDWVIALGGKGFGEAMHARGLLRGSPPPGLAGSEPSERDDSAASFPRMVL